MLDRVYALYKRDRGVSGGKSEREEGRKDDDVQDR